MIKGVTESGFRYELDDNVLDNMELVDILAEGEDGALAVSKITKCIMDEHQRKRLYEHHRGEDGRVPYTAVQKDISEMFLAFGQNVKNS